ncbi:sterile alpha motif domain-containing protein 3-like [Pseudorasbora parva]|uniref:sterile alpha motif domain-containing protein 3-like n=1 Tax=Pseudorasbora parva TaxID=51549 RepID=UPI00351F5AF1
MTDFTCWTSVQVCQWLRDIDLEEFCDTFVEHEIDGATLAIISERMSERLIPVIRKQGLFLAQLEKLKSTPTSREHPPRSSDHSSQALSSQDTSLVIPTMLRMAIDRRDSDLKSPSKTKLRALLIQTLFDHLSKKTMYPSHLQYIELLSFVITDHPFLRESIGSGYDSLLESLRNKFKKERQPLVANNEIQRMKAKWTGRKRPLQTAAANPSTSVDAGEDERSIGEHLRVMKEEIEKLRPNLELLKERMVRIKCYWRNFVSNHSTEEILSEFPCFRLAKMLLWDLRDHTNVDVDQQILTQLSVMAPRVLQVSRSPLKDKFRRKIEDCEDGRLKKGSSSNSLPCPEASPFLVKSPEMALVHEPTLPSDFSVSLKAVGKNKHFKVQLSNGVYCIGQRRFNSMDELLEHYKKAPIFTSEHGDKLYLIKPLQ